MYRTYARQSRRNLRQHTPARTRSRHSAVGEIVADTRRRSPHRIVEADAEPVRKIVDRYWSIGKCRVGKTIAIDVNPPLYKAGAQRLCQRHTGQGEKQGCLTRDLRLR